MSNKTTWKQIGIMKAWKIVCCTCFIICLLGTLSNLFFYFSPEIFAGISPVFSLYNDFISAYALYAAFLSGIASVVMFCGYQYTKGKLEEAETNSRKTSPDVMSELVAFSKRHSELLSRIDAASSLQEFEALREEVDKYNDDAESFAQETGVTPKVITYTDYDSKKSALMRRRTLPEKVEEWNLSYQYTNQLCVLKEEKQTITETLKNHIFDDIEFVPEPDNPFDDGAVAIYHNGKKVGYIYKDDNAQRMVRDWVRMERYFCGFISHYSKENDSIYYTIGFYKKD